VRNKSSIMVTTLLTCLAILSPGCTPLKADVVSENIQKHLEQGNTYFGQKQHDKAIDEFTRAIELNPQLAIGYYDRAYVYTKQQDWSSAVADLNKAIAIDPGLAAAYWLRGQVYYFNGSSYDQAIASYTKAIDLDPNFETAYFERAWAYVGNGAYDKAIEDFSRVLALDKGASDALYGRAWCYATRRNGRYRHGCTCFSTLRETRVVGSSIKDQDGSW
jgi:tetratricopeptide (TPR) repeat protein